MVGVVGGGDMEDDDGLNLSAFNMLPKPVINWGEDAKAKHQVRSMEFCEGCLYVDILCRYREQYATK